VRRSAAQPGRSTRRCGPTRSRSASAVEPKATGASPFDRLPSDQELARIYDAGHTLKELAGRYGVSASTIRERAIAGGATIRRPGPRMPPTRARAPRPVIALEGAVLPGRGMPR
jgi:hypothetical protein